MGAPKSSSPRNLSTNTLRPTPGSCTPSRSTIQPKPGLDRLGHAGTAGLERRRHQFTPARGLPQRHPLLPDCGADNWGSVVQFGKATIEWLSTFLKLPNGIASHDTFGRIFQILESAVLGRVCIEWLQSIAGTVEGVVSIDGKTLCVSRDGERAPLHLVSASAYEFRCDCPAATCASC